MPDQLIVQWTGRGLSRPTLLAGAAVLLLGGAAAAQIPQPAGADAPTPASAIKAVVVTGSHIQGAASPGPVYTVSQKDIALGGFSSLAQAISSLPMNFGGGVNVETGGSAAGGRDYANVNNAGAATANLRGLGATSTLVLLDGVRLPPKADGLGVDLSMIPLSAVDHVEVLADGASAVYGSDAVAGVVNIITRRGGDGFQTGLRYDTVDRGSPNYQASQAAGTSWSSGAVAFNYQHDQRGTISTADRAATRGAAIDNYLYPPQSEDAVALRVNQEIGRGWSGYIDGVYAERDMAQVVNLVPPGSSNSIYHSVTNNGGGSLVVGVRNDIQSRLRVDLFATVGRSQTVQDQFATPDEIGQGYSAELKETEITQAAAAELRLSGDLAALPAGVIKAAGGFSVRSDSASFNRFPGLNTFARDVYAAYGEIEAPLVAPSANIAGLRSAILSLAGRYEHYSDFGDTLNPRVGMIVEPLGGLTFKGAYSTSFRAPSSYEESTSGANSLIETAKDPLSASGTAIVLDRTGDNPALRPETSRNFTATLAYAPRAVPGLQLSMDYYDIDFSNRIQIVDTQNLGLFNIGAAAAQPILTRGPSLATVKAALAGSTIENLTFNPSFNTVDPASIQAIVDNRFHNVAHVRTRGIDFGGSWAQASAVGDWRLSGNATYILDFDQRFAPQDPFQNLVDTIYEPVGFKARAGLSWDASAWSAAVFANYVNSYTDNRVATARVRIGDWTTADLHLSYRFDDGLGLHGPGSTAVTLSVSNLFNTDPPRTAPNSYGFTYDPTNSSAIGRVVSLQFAKLW